MGWGVPVNGNVCISFENLFISQFVVHKQIAETNRFFVKFIKISILFRLKNVFWKATYLFLNCKLNKVLAPVSFFLSQKNEYQGLMGS